ncbi:MAG: hypothetical protein IH948_07580 [Bacteroidetes bacterium]|nr:hypothetical protein [Bacteroidota bacterium]
MMKGQSALDFLMTYGWALLLIVIVIGALFALGVFDISSFVGSRATGFAQVSVDAWRVDGNGNLTIQFANHVGKDIQLDNATVIFRGAETAFSLGPTNVSVGDATSTLSLGNIPGLTDGTSYTLQMIIRYTDLTANFSGYQSSGTLAGVSG